MNTTQLSIEQSDQELSMEDLSAVNGSGPVAMGGWIVLNLVCAGIPAFVDVAHDAPYTKEAMESKY